jgi:uncharacterized glyoxalase superfamily protein PhnB
LPKIICFITKYFSIFESELYPFMTQKSKKMDSLSPNLFVKDIRATIEFYKLLGFHVVMSVPGDGEGELVWAMAVCGSVTIMFQTLKSLGDTLPQILRPRNASQGGDALQGGDTQDRPGAQEHARHSDAGSQGGGSLLLYIKLRNIRAFFESIADKVEVVHGLEKTFYGATEFSIVDNNNFVLTFAEDESE